jgi:arylsulfatase A-like enzyme/Flp pilus assembly protein TadD
MLTATPLLSKPGARISVCAALALLALSNAAAAPTASASTPNHHPSVVLITLDTTRADRLGCYGRAGAGTPNLDRLAASGVRFNEAWSPAPITLPSHLSMMTGCTPVTHGVHDNGDTKYDGRIPTLASRFAAKGYRTAAVVSSSVLDSVWGANAGFGVYDERLGGKAERSGAETTTRALEILRSSKEPLFLWIHYFDAHWKYEPPAPFADRYRNDPYQGEIASVDSEIGRLLAGCAKAGLKPIVVVAGDHGEGLGEHSERTHGIFTYRSTLRVPFLISGPGIHAGRVVRDPVSLVDLAPTVAELTGLAPASIQDGVSLAGVVRRGAAAPASRRIYFESMLPFNSYGWVAPRGETDGRYVFIDLPKREVYDLKTDPGQTKSLYADADPLSAKLAGRFAEFTANAAERAGHGSRMQLTDEQRAKLASLGYVSGHAAQPTTAPLDPKDMIDIADRVDHAKELYESAHFNEAIADDDEILRRNPENGPARFVRGQALLAERRFGEAAKEFGLILVRNPSIAVARFNLGTSLAGARDQVRAEVEWRTAIETEPHFAEPRAALIAAQLARGDTAKALALSKEAAASGAESPELYVEIGLAYAASGNLEAAQSSFESAVRLRPTDVPALSNLGHIDYQRGRVDEALARYRAASAAAPKDPVPLKQIAAILLNDRKDSNGALAAFRAALPLEHDPEERAKLETMITGLSQEMQK